MLPGNPLFSLSFNHNKQRQTLKRARDCPRDRPVDKIRLTRGKTCEQLSLSAAAMTGDNLKLFSSTKPHILVLVSLALLLRTRIITGPRDLVHKLSHVGVSTGLSPSELNQALQQLYVEGSDGTRQLLVPFNNSISKARLIIFRLCLSLTTPSGLFASHS